VRGQLLRGFKSHRHRTSSIDGLKVASVFLDDLVEWLRL
jgi:hypothetical protein